MLCPRSVQALSHSMDALCQETLIQVDPLALATNNNVSVVETPGDVDQSS